MPGSLTRGGLSRGRTSADLAVDDARSERRHHPLRNREERWEGRESDSEAVEAQVEKDRKEQAKAAAKAKAVNKLKEQQGDDWTKEEDAKLRQAVLAIGFEETLGALNVLEGTDLHKRAIKALDLEAEVPALRTFGDLNQRPVYTSIPEYPNPGYRDTAQ